VVPVLDWKGRREWIRARGVGYTMPSELREAPEGAREAFPEIAWDDLKVSQEEGPVDMIIGKDNPGWMPFPVREEPDERFTLMWTILSSHYILRENKWAYGIGLAQDQASEAAAQPERSAIGGLFCASYASFLSSNHQMHSGKKDRKQGKEKAEKEEHRIGVYYYLVCTDIPTTSPLSCASCFTCLWLWLSGQEVQQGAPITHTPFQEFEATAVDL
jgi:hypothetical protein